MLNRLTPLILAACLIAAAPAHAADASAIIKASALRHGVPVWLAMAVAQRESGRQCGRVGKLKERGPMQVLPSTARALGYPGIGRKSCARQTDAGMLHLAKCFKSARGNAWRAAACHNGGPGMLTRKRIPAVVQRYANAVVPKSRAARATITTRGAQNDR